MTFVRMKKKWFDINRYRLWSVKLSQKHILESQPETEPARRYVDNAGSLAYMTSQNNHLHNARLKQKANAQNITIPEDKWPNVGISEARHASMTRLTVYATCTQCFKFILEVMVQPIFQDTNKYSVLEINIKMIIKYEKDNLLPSDGFTVDTKIQTDSLQVCDNR